MNSVIKTLLEARKRYPIALTGAYSKTGKPGGPLIGSKPFPASRLAKPQIALTGMYSKTGKPGGPLKTRHESLDEARKSQYKEYPNHPWIGKKAKSIGVGEGESVGTVHRVAREPTFSQLVPFVTTVTIKREDGTTTTHKKQNIRLIKEGYDRPAYKKRSDDEEVENYGEEDKVKIHNTALSTHGKRGKISQVAPSGHFYGVDDEKGNHIGYYHGSDLKRIKESDDVNEAKSSKASYHTVFYNHEGTWRHHFDADDAEDARLERESSKKQGEETVTLRVPKHDANWHQKSSKEIHNYVQTRLNSKKNNAYAWKYPLKEAVLDLGGLNIGYDGKRWQSTKDTQSGKNAQKARSELIKLHRNGQALTSNGLTPQAKALAKVIRHHFKGGKNVIDDTPPPKHLRVPGEHEMDENKELMKQHRQRRKPASLDDLQSKMNRQLDSKKRVSGRSLQRTREAIIKKKFDMGLE